MRFEEGCGWGCGVCVVAGLEHGFDVRVEEVVSVFLLGIADLDEVVYDCPLAHADFGQSCLAVETGGLERWVQGVAEGAVGESLRGVADQSF